MSDHAQRQNQTLSSRQNEPATRSHTAPQSIRTEHPILALQRTVGNQAVQRLLRSQSSPPDEVAEEVRQSPEENDAMNEEKISARKVPPPPRRDLPQGGRPTFPANPQGYSFCGIRVTLSRRHIHVEGDVILNGTPDERTIQIQLTGNGVDMSVEWPGILMRNNNRRCRRNDPHCRDNHISTTFNHIFNQPGNPELAPGRYCVTFFLLPNDRATTFTIANGQIRAY